MQKFLAWYQQSYGKILSFCQLHLWFGASGFTAHEIIHMMYIIPWATEFSDFATPENWLGNALLSPE